MKKFRLLAAMVITVVMLFTVAYAADVVIDAPAYNGTDDTYTVTVKAAKEMEVEMFCCLALKYPAAVTYTDGNATSADSGAGFTPMDGVVIYSADAATYTFEKDAAIMTATFSVDNKTGLVGSTFEIDMSNTDFCNSELVAWDVATSATVEAAGPVVAAGTKKSDATFDASDIVIGGVTYENVAIINGSATRPELQTGESIDKVYIEYEGAEVKDLTSIVGSGNVTYSVLFYGITDAEAEALAANVKTVFAGQYFPAN